MDLNFYTRPFRDEKYGTWVWDAKSNFVFQFDKTIPKNERSLILFRLNALDKETEEIPDYKLEYDESKTMIKNNGNNFIEIRGWGGLTGIGGHNFEANKAAKIQDDFALWLIKQLQK